MLHLRYILFIIKSQVYIIYYQILSIYYLLLNLRCIQCKLLELRTEPDIVTLLTNIVLFLPIFQSFNYLLPSHILFTQINNYSLLFSASFNHLNNWHFYQITPHRTQNQNWFQNCMMSTDNMFILLRHCISNNKIHCV